MAYDRYLRLLATKYTKEGRTLAQTAAVFKVNIGTLVGWRKRYSNRQRESENPPFG